MNKAFMREPDDTLPPRCPRCESLGVAVNQTTLEAHLTAEQQLALASTAAFCPFARCEVVYFDAFERIVTVEQLREPVWPKDPDAQICACFSFSTDEIDADVAEGSTARVKALVARARSSEAHCVTAAVSGHSCIGDVQRYYLRAQSAKRGA